MLEINVHEIKGHCPVHRVGDRIVVEMGEIDMDKTDNLCTHALGSLLHYTTALEHDVSPVELGLAAEGNAAFIQCPDPCAPYTSGGTVVFRCEKKVRCNK